MGFNDPIEPKVKKSKQKTPWDFRAPAYDERSSCYMDAGTHYGIGRINPVGHEGDPKMRAPTLPYGHPETQEVAHVPPEQLSPDYLI